MAARLHAGSLSRYYADCIATERLRKLNRSATLTNLRSATESKGYCCASLYYEKIIEFLYAETTPSDINSACSTIPCTSYDSANVNKSSVHELQHTTTSRECNSIRNVKM
eukprot:762714-Hanusia_phi.AAC.1